MYDIGSGYAPLVGQLLNKEVTALWHVGIGVYGYEYWFSNRIESKDLSEVESAFGMAPLRTIDVGEAVVSREDFEQWLEEELSKKFNVDTYDVMYNNCNHFADHAVSVRIFFLNFLPLIFLMAVTAQRGWLFILCLFEIW